MLLCVFSYLQGNFHGAKLNRFVDSGEKSGYARTTLCEKGTTLILRFFEKWVLVRIFEVV